jgi:hypothetical protein
MSINHLYKSLKKDKDSDNKDFTRSQTTDFNKNIKLIDEKGADIIYIIIKMFEMETNPKTTNAIPYEGKTVSAKELKFDLCKFPLNLRHIIYRFLKIHIKNIEEENKLNLDRKNISL